MILSYANIEKTKFLKHLILRQNKSLNTCYYIDTSVLLGNTLLVKSKIHSKPHPGLEWRIFHILISEDIDDFIDIKFIL